MVKDPGPETTSHQRCNMDSDVPYAHSQLNSHFAASVGRDDLIALYVEALQNPEFKGTYNGTAPNPVRMAELCASLGSALGRPSWLPVPDFALQVP